MTNKSAMTGFEIAIIGMAGRFPGAKNIEEFWNNICNEKESISFFTQDEMLSEGVDIDLLSNPNYVNAGGVLQNHDQFDAAFFNYSPNEAKILNPQHRIFLECAWEALENAAYAASNYQGVVGVYAGSSSNLYLREHLHANEQIVEDFGMFQLAIANSKDQLCTRVSHALNLTGPSINIQTACSTSLVAVHLACQSLLNGDCTMALAGAVSIQARQKTGYLYQEGMTLSPDGHCRAFDSLAKGTVGGNGAGVVVLKRYQDALADGDRIDAIIKSTAINNDGNCKIGYTAPSIQKQADVIAEAINMARITANAITYVETHGTGTLLGDPIEIAGLTNAFSRTTNKKDFCAIGSVKTNIGHLDVASGIVGLIKTILALKKKILPASINFKSSNTNIHFENTPFFVNSATKPWIVENMTRIAGISSFGIGGTNAHIILEEAPSHTVIPSDRKTNILCLSAKSQETLEQKEKELIEKLVNNPDINLRNVAFSMNVGRESFPFRKTVIFSDMDEIKNCSDNKNIISPIVNVPMGVKKNIVFLFTGQGSQYINMGKSIYFSEPTYRYWVDYCAKLLNSHLDINLLQLLYPDDNYSLNKHDLNDTVFAQPALFIIEYAMAKLWLSWGVNPAYMIGHSLGEYVAAGLSGIFSLEDVLKLISVRASLMQSMPKGKMLAVYLNSQKLTDLLVPGVSIAAVNADDICVVSGASHSIEILEQSFLQRNIAYSALNTSHAFHSEMMEPIMDELKVTFQKIKLNTPQIPVVSNLTGNFITDHEAQNPDYWIQHLRGTVLFNQGIKNLSDKGDIFLEIGPGKTLSTLAKKSLKNNHSLFLSSLPASNQSDDKNTDLLIAKTLTALWRSGVNINFQNVYSADKCSRLELPTYPFRSDRYWVDLPKIKQATLVRKEANTNLISNNFTDNSYVQIISDKTNKAFEQNFSCVEAVKSNTLVEDLTVVWKSVLGIDNVNSNEDFYELGGHSLLAVQLVVKINKLFNTNFPIVWVVENNTICQQAGYLSQRKKTYAQYNPLVKFNKKEIGVPLFLIHPGHAGAEAYNGLANLINDDVPLYAVESYNLYSGNSLLYSIRELAELYIQYIKKTVPAGPYYLGGWSLGGTIAYEIAFLLTEMGDQVMNVFMIDSFLFNNTSEIQAKNLDSLFYGLEEDLAFQKLPAEYKNKLLQIYPAELDMLRSYRAGKYHGKVVLFNATKPSKLKIEMNASEKSIFGSIKMHNGWNEHAVNMRQVLCEADHYSIMTGSNLKNIALLIKENFVTTHSVVPLPDLIRERDDGTELAMV